MDYTTLQVYRRGPVGWLIFNRPGAGNAIDAVMFDELEAAWTELDTDPEVRVIVNTGNGPNFQTGLDLVQLTRNPDALKAHSRRTRDADLRFTAWHLGVTKPVVAAVHGLCAGGGLHFVADADIVIAASDAQFTDPHVSVGQVAAYEPIGLTAQSPAGPVWRMALAGVHERMSAARAYELGLISEIVNPPKQLHTRADEIAKTIARNSPTSLTSLKQALWAALD